ncbi:hypothetical protein GQ457_16G015070 [Hibiscus cannabinus]
MIRLMHQSAFVPARSIVDNIMIARELMGYNMSTLPPKFSPNGSLFLFFKGAKRVRQRDPLSPYLFVITMNILSKLLDKAIVNGFLNFHPKHHKIRLTNLCFANDLLIFSGWTFDSVIGVWRVLQLFHSFSVLQINPVNSRIFSTSMG